MYTLSIAEMRAAQACDLDARIADIRNTLGRDVAEDEAIPLKTWWDLKTTAVRDMAQMLKFLGEPGRRIGVRAACLAARRASPFVREHVRPAYHSAIEAAEGWLRGETTQEDCHEVASCIFAGVGPAGAFAVAACTVAAAAATATADADRYISHALNHAATCAGYTYAAELKQQRAELYLIAFGMPHDAEGKRVA